jgi:signal peptidase I
MMPTLNGEFLLVDYFSYSVLQKKPKKGDIVLSQQGVKLVTKRVAAIEGEMVEVIKDGQVDNLVIPKDHVWLLGDNPAQSQDSRAYGAVKCSAIRGKALYKLNSFEEVK